MDVRQDTQHEKNTFEWLVGYFKGIFCEDTQDRDLLQFLRHGSEDGIEIFKAVASYGEFLNLVNQLRAIGYSSISAAPCTELEFYLLFDAVHMDMGAKSYAFSVKEYKGQWDKYRHALNNDHFSMNTAHGRSLRFAIAENRLHTDLVGKDKQIDEAALTNQHVLRFLSVGRGFRYISSCHGEQNVLKQFCEYLVQRGYVRIKPEEFDSSKIIGILKSSDVNPVFFLQPFSLPPEYSIETVVDGFEYRVGARKLSTPETKRRRVSLFPTDRADELKERETVFLGYLINSGFRWLASRNDLEIVIEKLKTKSLIPNIDINSEAMMAAMATYVEMRKQADRSDRMNFTNQLASYAEGDAGSLFPELPPRFGYTLGTSPTPSTPRRP